MQLHSTPITTGSQHNHSSSSKIPPRRAARIAAGLSIDDVAQRLHISPRYYTSIERGAKCPIKTARRLARLLGCNGNIFLYPADFLLAQEQSQVSASAAVGADTRERANRRYSSRRQPILTLVAGGDGS